MAQQEWRALNNLNWTHEGKEYEAAAGDKITDLPENVVKHERAAGNLEPWKERHTENVKDHTTNSVQYGVRENKDGVMEEFQEGELIDNG